jgi:hypothetical protein
MSDGNLTFVEARGAGDGCGKVTAIKDEVSTWYIRTRNTCGKNTAPALDDDVRTDGEMEFSTEEEAVEWMTSKGFVLTESGAPVEPTPAEAKTLQELATDAEEQFDKTRSPSDAFAAYRLARACCTGTLSVRRKTLGVREQAIADPYHGEPSDAAMQLVISCNRMIELMNLAEAHLIQKEWARLETHQGAIDSINTIRDLIAEARAARGY